MDATPHETPALATLRENAARLWHDGRPAEAARLYGEAARLAADPGEALLWQGHALRAAGQHEAALEAYARAAAEAPAEPDPHRYRGHALLLLGRRAEASQAYSLALALDTGRDAGVEAEAALRRLEEEATAPPEAPRPPRPATPASSPAPLPAADASETVQPATTPLAGGVRALVHLPRPSPAAPPQPRPATRLAPPPRPRMAMLRAGGAPIRAAAHPAGLGLAFDLSDLLLHFARRRTLTGIQRVQASLIGAALRTGLDASFLAFAGPRPAWRALPTESLKHLLSLAAAGSDAEEPAWIAARDAVTEAALAGQAHSFPPGATLVSLGSPWGIPDYFRGVRAVQAGSGLRYLPFLHDCVPLVMPEHCVRTLVQDYARWFAALGVHAQGVLCNSECTRADGRRFLEALLPGLDLPMAVIPLDADPRGGMPPDPAALEGTRAPRPPEPYVLFVATVESRKDHLTVFRAWLTLLRRHGPARIPRLVCVGAEGWHAEAALALLAGSPELSAHVVLLHEISDGALAALYRDCLFTLYNSHYEGWGLPVTESIAWGKVPVVPAHSALVESGAGAAVFVEPQSEGAMVATVERLLFEPGALPAAEAALAARGPGRGWEAVLAQLVSAIEELVQAPATPLVERLTVPFGMRLSLRRSDSIVPDLATALSEVVREGAGWRAPEDWGTPLAGGIARLRLPLPPGAAGSLRLHLELRAGESGPIGLRLFADAAPAGAATIPDPPHGDFATALPVQVAEETRVLELELDTPPNTGLRGLMLCREDDLLARLEFLEAQRLPQPVG
jgi:glycosyltransferase involved in cell wall biosynthesis